NRGCDIMAGLEGATDRPGPVAHCVAALDHSRTLSAARSNAHEPHDCLHRDPSGRTVDLRWYRSPGRPLSFVVRRGYGLYCRVLLHVLGGMARRAVDHQTEIARATVIARCRSFGAAGKVRKLIAARRCAVRATSL